MRSLYLLGLALVLSSCIKDPLMDLNQFVEKSGSENYPVKENIPVLSTISPLQFCTNYDRDPFSKLQEKDIRQVLSPSQVLVSDLSERAKEPLENFPLTDLFMQGTLVVDKSMWGIIESKDGELFMVKVGSHIGLDHGIVLKVLIDEISITEGFLDKDQHWRESFTKIELNHKEQ